jgi:hypothetical protein
LLIYAAERYSLLSAAVMSGLRPRLERDVFTSPPQIEI